MIETPTTERAQAAASTAADEGKHVAGVAQEEVQRVAGEATAQGGRPGPSVPASVGGFFTPGRDTFREATAGSTFLLAVSWAVGLVLALIAIRRRRRG